MALTLVYKPYDVFTLSSEGLYIIQGFHHQEIFLDYSLSVYTCSSTSSTGLPNDYTHAGLSYTPCPVILSRLQGGYSYFSLHTLQYPGICISFASDNPPSDPLAGHLSGMFEITSRLVTSGDFHRHLFSAAFRPLGGYCCSAPSPPPPPVPQRPFRASPPEPETAVGGGKTKGGEGEGEGRADSTLPYLLSLLPFPLPFFPPE